jgi:molybdopterin synthase sulfur carrier subunit
MWITILHLTQLFFFRNRLHLFAEMANLTIVVNSTAMSTNPLPEKTHQNQAHFTILYFASASSFTHKRSETLPAPLNVGKLFDVLEERYEGFKEKVLTSCLCTVNMEYVDLEATGEGEVLIRAGDEVAIIPPVSSG